MNREAAGPRGPSAPRVHRRDVQGLRGVAVALVVLYHAGVPALSGGFVGVDVFFVLSGYLIVGLLAEEVHRTGTVSLRGFLARRIRRLLPASMLVLVVTAVAAKLVLPPLATAGVGRDAVAAALHTANNRFALAGVDYLAGEDPSPLQHYWSLAVEEQFYLLVALLVVLASWARRRSAPAVLAVVLAAGAVLSFVLCVELTSTHQPYAFFTLPARAWEIAVGGLLALALRRRPHIPAIPAAALGWAGLAAVVAAATLFSDATPFPGWAAAVPVLGTAALIAAGTTGAGRLHRLLCARPLTALGDLSYPLYLWHWPLLVLPALAGRTALPAWSRAALVVAAVLLAVLTHRFVEDPVRRSAVLARRPGTTYGLAAATCAAALAVAGWAQAMPALDAGRPAPAALSGAVPAGYTPGYVPSNLQPALPHASGDVSRASRDGCLVAFRVTRSPECRYGDPAGRRTVVLLGDSHADTWFPPLERIAVRRGLRLVVLTKSSCPPALVLAHQTRLNRPFTECQEWRTTALARIAELRPAAVVVAGYGRQQLVGDASPRVWRDGVTGTLRALPPGTAAFWLADNPAFPEAVPVCLSAALHEPVRCGARRAGVLDRDRMAAERAAVEGAGATYVDTSAWLCPGADCQVINGNHLMYRDAHHLTATYTASLTGVLDEVLAPALGAALPT